MEMINYTPLDFINLIDSKFEQFVGSIGRLNIQWGTWSREMNIVINDRMNDENGHEVYALIFAYWITVSQLLDLLYQCTGLREIMRRRKIKAKTDEALAIRKRIEELNGSY